MLRISKLTDYAVVLATHLATAREAQPVSDLAVETRIPQPTVSKVLKALTKAGVVVSQRGAHGGYMLFSPHHKRELDEVDQMEAARPGLPSRIPRHSFVDRMFHWVMAVSMLALVFTAFLPVVGVKIAWVQWH